MKVTKHQKLGIVFILSFALICCITAYMLKPSETTLATEIKLKTYETLNNNEPLTEEDLKDADRIREWAMPIVDEILASGNVTLTEEENEKVYVSIVQTLNLTVDAGNIEIDEDGNLTSLSKSYVSNAIANAITYAVPTVDLSSTLDSGTTQYEQILDMQKTLNALSASNEELTESVNLVNETYQNTVSEQYTSIEAVDTALTEKVDALYTDLLAQITANKETGEKLSSEVKDIQEIIKDLTDTQTIILSDLSTAVTNIQNLTTDVQTLYATDESTQLTIQEINSNIVEINQNIEVAKSTLQQEQAASKKELSDSIEATKSTLQGELEKNIQDLSKKVTDDLAALKKETGDNNKETNDLIDQTEETLQGAISDTKQEIEAAIEEKEENLQIQITENLTNLTTIINNNMTTLSNLIGDSSAFSEKTIAQTTADLAAAVQEVNNSLTESVQEIDEQIEVLSTDLGAVTERVTAAEEAISTINQQIAAMTTRYDEAIAALWAQVNANSADILALQQRLDAFIISSDGHNKVDMIPEFTIGVGDWVLNGSNASYTVANDYLIDCTMAQVNYAAQYDITPAYATDPTIGTLTITIPASQIQEIKVTGILVYHIESDDKAQTQTLELDENEDPETPGGEDPDTPGNENPANGDPATDEPTNDEPTNDEPTTDEPTTDEPTTDEPENDTPQGDPETTVPEGEETSGGEGSGQTQGEGE